MRYRCKVVFLRQINLRPNKATYDFVLAARVQLCGKMRERRISAQALQEDGNQHLVRCQQHTGPPLRGVMLKLFIMRPSLRFVCQVISAAWRADSVCFLSLLSKSTATGFVNNVKNRWCGMVRWCEVDTHEVDVQSCFPDFHCALLSCLNSYQLQRTNTRNRLMVRERVPRIKLMVS